MLLMEKGFDYFQYEEKTAVAHLKKLAGAQTFKMGLELSDLAIKMLFASVSNEFPALSYRARIGKLAKIIRSM
jgi:hypothetical protein